VERCISVGEVGVELDTGIVTIVGVEAAGVATEPTGPEELTI